MDTKDSDSLQESLSTSVDKCLHGFPSVQSLKDQVLEECSNAEEEAENVFHGKVNVHNIVELASNQLSDTNLKDFSPIKTLKNLVGNPLSAFTSGFNSETLKEVFETNNDPENAPNSDSNGGNNSNNESTPLINKSKKKGGTAKLLKYAAGTIAILAACATVPAAVITSMNARSHQKDNNDDYPVNFTHHYRDRNFWHALPPKENLPQLKYIPPKFLIVADTGTKPCNSSTGGTNCTVIVQNIQASQLAGPYEDITYNFLVGGDGLIYQGRAIDKRGASIRGMDCSSLIVAFIGSFQSVAPPEKQMNAFTLLVYTLESTGKISKSYTMFMESDILRRDSPGKMISDTLRNWPHWAPFTPKDYLCDES